MVIIAFDSHKRYTFSSVENEKGKIIDERRIDHKAGALMEYLSRFPKGSEVAVETIGNWYWIVDEIEKAGMKPLLVHARKAKLLSGSANKTDRLDARAMNKLNRANILPTVWIPPREVRDKRDVLRTRMRFVNQRTQLKNRMHGILSQYALNKFEASDIYGKRNRAELELRLDMLPQETRVDAFSSLHMIDTFSEELLVLEKRIMELFDSSEDAQLIETIPGIGFLLSTVIIHEIGDIGRFPSAEHFASYSGTTPRVHSSGGKTRYGRLRKDVNHYLKWAFSEAGNSVCVNHTRKPELHVSKLYSRVRSRKGHSIAIGAVARHIAESCFWVLSKGEAYKEPQKRSHQGKRRRVPVVNR